MELEMLRRSPYPQEILPPEAPVNFSREDCEVEYSRGWRILKPCMRQRRQGDEARVRTGELLFISNNLIVDLGHKSHCKWRMAWAWATKEVTGRNSSAGFSPFGASVGN